MSLPALASVTGLGASYDLIQGDIGEMGADAAAVGVASYGGLYGRVASGIYFLGKGLFQAKDAFVSRQFVGGAIEVVTAFASLGATVVGLDPKVLSLAKRSVAKSLLSNRSALRQARFDMRWASFGTHEQRRNAIKASYANLPEYNSAKFAGLKSAVHYGAADTAKHLRPIFDEASSLGRTVRNAW